MSTEVFPYTSSHQIKNLSLLIKMYIIPKLSGKDKSCDSNTRVRFPELKPISIGHMVELRVCDANEDISEANRLWPP